MSELKAIRSEEIYDIIEYEACYRTDGLYYLKSEADKVIAELKDKLDLYKRGWEENDKVNENIYAQLCHHKYKRCLAMAKWCRSRACFYDTMREDSLYWAWKSDRAYKWHKRWLELAEKFKEGV